MAEWNGDKLYIFLALWSDIPSTENERLPTELGWTKKANPISLDEITQISELITNANESFNRLC
jgi:hypothetical protein